MELTAFAGWLNSFNGKKATDYLILGCTVRNYRRTYAYGFDDISLALGIITVDNINRRPDLNVEPSVISKISK